MDTKPTARLLNLIKYYISKDEYSILKSTGCYLFLYFAYTVILYYFSYCAWFFIRRIGFTIIPMTMIVLFLSYILINHLLIKKVVGLRIIIIFESMLFITLILLAICYAYIEYKYHGNYSVNLIALKRLYDLYF